MGRILNNFLKQEIGGIDLEKEALQQELYLRDLALQQQGMGYSGGQPLPPMPSTVIPPAMEREVMEKYLDVPIPENLNELQGEERFWMETSPVVRHLAFTSLNAAQQKRILDDLQIARDFQGCDNVDSLIQNKQFAVLARVQTDKARNDFDGIRERLVPSIGWSIGQSGPFGTGKETGERPKESRAFFGLFGGQKRG